MNIIESLVDKVKNLNKETLLDIAISVIVIALIFYDKQFDKLCDNKIVFFKRKR